MFFWQNRKNIHFLLGLDLFLVAISFVFSYWVKRHLPLGLSGLTTDPNYYLILFLLLLSSCFCFLFYNLYSPFSISQLSSRLLKVWWSVGSAIAGLVLALYVFHQQDVSRLLLGIHFLVASTLCSFRFLLSSNVFALLGKRRKDEVKVLVVGCKDQAKEMIKAILSAPNTFYNVVGTLDPARANIGKVVVNDVKVIGDMANFQDTLLDQVVDEVIFALPLNMIPDVNTYISFAEKVGVKIRIMPDWQLQKLAFQPETASVSFENFVGIPCLSLSSTPDQDGRLIIKRLLDFFLSLFGLLFFLPLLLAISLLIKISSKGPAIFSQERIGLNGRPFQMYKFRSMIVDAEDLREDLLPINEMEGPVFKIKNDPRVTLVGSFLRKTSLDELPQLINVLKGEMSLVGPRPPLSKEVEGYQPFQRRRLSMRPGITCIWQVSGRNKLTFEEWMKLDLQYIDEWSLWLDFKLLLLTIRAVFAGTGV